MTSFTVPGIPVPKGRARHTQQLGAIRTYTPMKTRDYEALVQLTARVAIGKAPPMDGPVHLHLRFTMPLLSSHAQTFREMAKEDRKAHHKRPDLDNLVKSIMDGCNGIVWLDDAQVCCLTASKMYGEVPRVQVLAQQWLSSF